MFLLIACSSSVNSRENRQRRILVRNGRLENLIFILDTDKRANKTHIMPHYALYPASFSSFFCSHETNTCPVNGYTPKNIFLQGGKRARLKRSVGGLITMCWHRIPDNWTAGLIAIRRGVLDCKVTTHKQCNVN